MRGDLENSGVRSRRCQFSLENDLPFSMNTHSDKDILLFPLSPDSSSNNTFIDDTSIYRMIDRISQVQHSSMPGTLADHRVLIENRMNTPNGKIFTKVEMPIDRSPEVKLEDSVYRESSEEMITEETTNRKSCLRRKISAPSGGGKKRGPYRKYTQLEKEALVAEAKLLGIGCIVKKQKIARKTLCRWISDGVVRRYGGGRQVGDFEMEAKLMLILRAHFSARGCLPEKFEIQQLAKELSSNTQFTASHGWFQKFYLRHKHTLDHMMEAQDN